MVLANWIAPLEASRALFIEMLMLRTCVENRSWSAKAI